MARFIIAYKKKKQIKLQVSGVEEYAQSHSADYTGANGIYIANSDKEDGTQDYIHTNGKYSISRTLNGDENINFGFSWWRINKLEINDGSFFTDGIATGTGFVTSEATEISKIPFLVDGSSASWRFGSDNYQEAAGVSVTKVKDVSSDTPSTSKDTILVYSPDETRNTVYGGEWKLLDQNATGQDRVWYKKGSTSYDDLYLWYSQNDGWIVIGENKHDGPLSGTPAMSTNASIGLTDPYLENGQSLVWGEWNHQST